MADSWMTTRDDSVFIICATASRHFSSGQEPIQRLCKLCFATATSSDASVLQPRSQPRSHGRCRENVNCDSQLCARQKRTDSGLNWKTVQDKFFKDMDVCVGLLAHLLDAD